MSCPHTCPHPHRPAADLSHFFAVTALSNPVRFKRRYELYTPFERLCLDAGVQLITVEQAFGDRPFMVTKSSNPHHVQVRSVEELWVKENLINLGIHRAAQLDPEMREIAWIDADIKPALSPRDWFEETWHALQHFHFVQMFSEVLDLDRFSNGIGCPRPGFMNNYVTHGTPTPERIAQLKKEQPYGSVFGMPGFAWAATRFGLDSVGGLIDFSILGAGDWHMANGLIGNMQAVARDFVSEPYKEKLLRWEMLCERWIKRDVGFVPGLILHDFHGKRSKRGYLTRPKILRENQYNPDEDIKYDVFGQLQLETWTPRQIKFRDQIRQYFVSRDEDSTEL